MNDQFYHSKGVVGCTPNYRAAEDPAQVNADQYMKVRQNALLFFSLAASSFQLL